MRFLLMLVVLLLCPTLDPALGHAQSPCANMSLRDVTADITAHLAENPNKQIIETAQGQFRITLPAGRFGGDSGISTQIRLMDHPAKQACLAYDVFLPSNFTFMRGGKLPGLYGGPADMTQSTASGCRDDDDRTGWTMRLMWRQNGDGEAYGYTNVPNDRCGSSFGRGNWVFPRQQWISLYIVTFMNEHKGDGRMMVYIDDRQVIDQQGLTYLDSTDNGVHGLFLSVFFGGNSRDWAPITDQYLDIRNIRFGVADH